LSQPENFQETLPISSRFPGGKNYSSKFPGVLDTLQNAQEPYSSCFAPSSQTFVNS